MSLIFTDNGPNGRYSQYVNNKLLSKYSQKKKKKFLIQIKLRSRTKKH